MAKTKSSPNYLPQMSAPLERILQELDNEGVKYEVLDIDPNELNTSQPFVFSNNVAESIIDENNPIWMSEENNIIDGHHRLAKSLEDEKTLKAVKVGLNFKNACRVLNKIQDIFEYEESHKMEEVIGQDVINSGNEIDSGVSDDEFLGSLEEDNIATQDENTEKNKKTIIGYRKDPLKENSVVGNFFMLAPINGFDKYEIEFDNLMDTDELGFSYKESQKPVDILAKIWFPNINFEKISEQYNMSVDNLKAKAIAKKAQRLGFDGIKYGDTLVQGLK
jgi:hypothetical protein